MEAAARKQFELENNITTLVDPAKDSIYGYDVEAQKALDASRPWVKDPSYFKHVRISAVALIKMAMHARSGGHLEVMGLMQGKIAHETFVVTDAYALPVEGTETRVNAQEEAYEYMAAYSDAQRGIKREENVIGWYHSHPGYGCWLSGIDVGTQMTQQKYLDPFLAVVVDPDRTISAGKVEIGAFRAYPEGHKARDADEDEGGYQSIPLSKIEDFGAHSSQYYPLEISHFKSSLDTHLLDLLWNKYWVSTLSQSPLLTNRDYGTKQMLDLSQKIAKCEHSIASGGSKPHGRLLQIPGKGSGTDTALEKVVRDSTKITSEEIVGLFSNVVKERVFANPGAPAPA